MKVPKRIKTLIVDCPNEDCLYWRNRDCKYSAYLVAQCGEYKPMKKEKCLNIRPAGEGGMIKETKARQDFSFHLPAKVSLAEMPEKPDSGLRRFER